MQLRELNNRFNKDNSELLLCATRFNRSDCFSAFDKKKVVLLAESYPNDSYQ